MQDLARCAHVASCNCVVKQVDEYTHLKEKLEKEVRDLRKREQQLVLGEQQVLYMFCNKY